MAGKVRIMQAGSLTLNFIIGHQECKTKAPEFPKKLRRLSKTYQVFKTFEVLYPITVSPPTNRYLTLD